MTCLWLRDYNMLPKKELHSRLWIEAMWRLLKTWEHDSLVNYGDHNMRAFFLVLAKSEHCSPLLRSHDVGPSGVRKSWFDGESWPPGTWDEDD